MSLPYCLSSLIYFFENRKRPSISRLIIALFALLYVSSLLSLSLPSHEALGQSNSVGSFKTTSQSQRKYQSQIQSIATLVRNAAQSTLGVTLFPVHFQNLIILPPSRTEKIDELIAISNGKLNNLLARQSQDQLSGLSFSDADMKDLDVDEMFRVVLEGASTLGAEPIHLGRLEFFLFPLPSDPSQVSIRSLSFSDFSPRGVEGRLDFKLDHFNGVFNFKKNLYENISFSLRDFIYTSSNVREILLGSLSLTYNPQESNFLSLDLKNLSVDHKVTSPYTFQLSSLSINHDLEHLNEDPEPRLQLIEEYLALHFQKADQVLWPINRQRNQSNPLLKSGLSWESLYRNNPNMTLNREVIVQNLRYNQLQKGTIPSTSYQLGQATLLDSLQGSQDLWKERFQEFFIDPKQPQTTERFSGLLLNLERIFISNQELNKPIELSIPQISLALSALNQEGKNATPLFNLLTRQGLDQSSNNLPSTVYQSQDQEDTLISNRPFDPFLSSLEALTSLDITLQGENLRYKVNGQEQITLKAGALAIQAHDLQEPSSKITLHGSADAMQFAEGFLAVDPSFTDVVPQATRFTISLNNLSLPSFISTFEEQVQSQLQKTASKEEQDQDIIASDITLSLHNLAKQTWKESQSDSELLFENVYFSFPKTAGGLQGAIQLDYSAPSRLGVGLEALDLTLRAYDFSGAIESVRYFTQQLSAPSLKRKIELALNFGAPFLQNSAMKGSDEYGNFISWKIAIDKDRNISFNNASIGPILQMLR